MRTAWFFALVFLSFQALTWAKKGLEFPRYDGKDRVLDIDSKNYRKALKSFHMLCLFYHAPPPASKELQKQFQMTELVLEVRERVQETHINGLDKSQTV